MRNSTFHTHTRNLLVDVEDLNSWRDVSTRRISFVSGLPTNGDPCIPAKATAHDPRSWSFKLPLIYLSNLSRTAAPRLQNHDATFGLFILASDEDPLIAVGGTEGMARPAVGRLVIAMRTIYGIRTMLAQYVNCRIIRAYSNSPHHAFQQSFGGCRFGQHRFRGPS